LTRVSLTRAHLRCRHCHCVCDQAGTLLTAIPGQWNAISGTVITMDGTDIVVMVKQLPVGIDVYIDDITLSNCSIENFRYAMSTRIKFSEYITIACKLRPQ
jgi:hypothetical protein